SVNLELTPNPTIGNIVVDNCTIPATVTIQATSGSSQIFYSIDGGATYLDNGGVFNNVYPGTYNVSIKDGNGCVATDTVTVYPLMEASVELTKLLDCSPSPEAQITIDVLNGSGSYDYEIADGSGTIVARQALVAPLVFPTLFAGDYNIIVHDNNPFAAACPRTFDVTVPPIVMPVFSIDAYTNATCADSDDGTIRVSAVENGTGPFTFEIIAGPGSTASFPILPTSNTQATATFNALEGLEAGITYTIEITAANGCKTTLDQLILEPAPIAAIDLTVEPFVCVVGNNGNHASITVNSATGGTGTYVRYEFINNDGNV